MGLTPTTIDEAIQAARQSPEAWPEILAAVRNKQFVARAFVTRNLALYAAAFRNPDSPGESDAWFLEGCIVFEVLLAFELSASSAAGLQELIIRGAYEAGVSEIATAAVQLGSSLKIAAQILSGPRPSPAYAAIAACFANDLLEACDREVKRRQAGRSWGRFGQWLRAKFSAPSQLAASRLDWPHDSLIQLRIAALQYRAELDSGATHPPPTAEIEAELRRLSSPAQARRTQAALEGDKGRIAFNNGSYADAVTALQEAVRLWGQGQEPEDQAALAEVLTLCGRAEARAGDPWQALSDLDRGIALLQATGNAADEFFCDALIARGVLHEEVNGFSAADRDLTAALAMLEDLPSNPARVERIAETLSNRGYARVRLHRLDAAISDLSRSLRLIETAGDPNRDLLATALHNRGNAFYEQGRVPAATEDLQKALELRRQMAEDEQPEHLDTLAAVGRDLGRVIHETQSSEEALPLLELVVNLRTHLVQQDRNIETIHKWAVAIFPLCDAQVNLDKLEDALENAGNVVDAYRTLVNTFGINARRLDLAAARHMRAYVLSKLTRYAEARQEEQRAIQLFRELAASGSSEEYASELGRALAVAGEIEEADGNWRGAALLLEESAGLLESTVAEALTEQERQFRRTSFSSNIRRLIHLACRLDLQGAPPPPQIAGAGATWAERAVYWTERSRARNLADLMATARQNPFGVSPAEYAAYEQCGRQLRDLDFRLREMENQLEPSRQAALADLQQQVAAAREQRSRLLDRLHDTQASFRQKDPNWARGAAPLTVQEIRRTAAACNATLLTLDVAPQGVMAVLVPAVGPVQARVIDALKVEDVAGWATAWQTAEAEYRELGWFDRDSDQKRETWWNAIESTLADIGARLWTPLRDWVAQATPATPPAAPRLVLLPGVFLNAFPLHAARTGASRLIDEFEAIFVPSIDVLSRRLGATVPPEFNLIAVRNPTSDSSGLAWTEVEVDEVRRSVPQHLVLGPAGDPHIPPATRERLMQELPAYTVALLATHGVYSSTASWNNSGVLTAGQDGRGLMTIRDFYDIDLARVRLVLLTACESARSEIGDLTGEQLGLPSAVLAAGAGAVVGSLWRVNDVSTALLVRQFFIELKQVRLPGTALRNAQHWLSRATRPELESVFHQIGRPQDIAQIPDMPAPYAHPVYWAAFACFGGY